MAEIGHDYEIVVIDGGNMGAALLGGLFRDGIVIAEQVAVVELSAERRQVVRKGWVLVSESIPTCRAAVLAVKPPAIAEVAAAATPLAPSVCCRLQPASQRQRCGPHVATGLTSCSMPNTPAMVGKGVTVCTDARATAVLDWAEELLTASAWSSASTKNTSMRSPDSPALGRRMCLRLPRP